MQRDLGVLTLLFLVVCVLVRAFVMRRQGIRAMHFASMDRSDFVILPCALVYFYVLLAGAFHLPVPGRLFFESSLVAWTGVGLCGLGLGLFLLSIVSFGRSFRVGIDATDPDQLVTTGIFAFSRNPIYVAFGIILGAEFLIFPNWIVLIYAVAGVALCHRQVLLEEAYLRRHYGSAYDDYRRRVRRYF